MRHLFTMNIFYQMLFSLWHLFLGLCPQIDYDHLVNCLTDVLEKRNIDYCYRYYNLFAESGIIFVGEQVFTAYPSLRVDFSDDAIIIFCYPENRLTSVPKLGFFIVILML